MTTPDVLISTQSQNNPYLGYQSKILITSDEFYSAGQSQSNTLDNRQYTPTEDF
ncbi:MAG: hypothetical protein JEZ12_27275 [Desulfobacterium sp.]|nr:hypothetical protein [Desulfobacterium sp.]